MVLVESFTQLIAVAFTIWLSCPPTFIRAVATESQWIFWSNSINNTLVLHDGGFGKLIIGFIGGEIIASQYRSKPSKATLLSLIKLIVTHPLELTGKGKLVPENGSLQLVVNLCQGHQIIRISSKFGSVSIKVKIISIVTAPGGQIVKV